MVHVDQNKSNFERDNRGTEAYQLAKQILNHLGIPEHTVLQQDNTSGEWDDTNERLKAAEFTLPGKGERKYHYAIQIESSGPGVSNRVFPRRLISVTFDGEDGKRHEITLHASREGSEVRKEDMVYLIDGKRIEPDTFQEEEWGKWQHDRAYVEMADALDALNEYLESRTGEITHITIGGVRDAASDVMAKRNESSSLTTQKLDEDDPIRDIAA